jgi:hypothetical protein
LVNFYQTTRCYNPEDSNLDKSLFVIEADLKHKVVWLIWEWNVGVLEPTMQDILAKNNIP